MAGIAKIIKKAIFSTFHNATNVNQVENVTFSSINTKYRKIVSVSNKEIKILGQTRASLQRELVRVIPLRGKYITLISQRYQKTNFKIRCFQKNYEPVCGIADLWRLWMIPNWSKNIKWSLKLIQDQFCVIQNPGNFFWNQIQLTDSTAHFQIVPGYGRAGKL